MSPGQYQTIAVEPLRVPRIMLEKLGPKSVGHGCGAHRHAGMAGVRVLDSIDRQHSDRVDTFILQFSIDFRVHLYLHGRRYSLPPAVRAIAGPLRSSRL